MDEQTTEQPCVWEFAPEYEARFKELPPSQRREVLKRLTGRRRNPLTPEQCREPCPDVEQTLEAVHKAYLNKKVRSKAASATKRMIDRAQPAEVEPEAEAEPEVEAVSNVVASIRLEPSEITADVCLCLFVSVCVCLCLFVSVCPILRLLRCRVVVCLS